MEFLFVPSTIFPETWRTSIPINSHLWQSRIQPAIVYIVEPEVRTGQPHDLHLYGIPNFPPLRLSISAKQNDVPQYKYEKYKYIGIHGHPWMSMHNVRNGCPWMYMDIHGYPWGCPWMICVASDR